MSSTISAPWEIETVPPEERKAALHQVFDWEEESARHRRIAGCMQAAESAPMTFQFLLQARRGDQRLGAVWGHVLPGRVANVWPPRLAGELAEPESMAVFDALQSSLDQQLSSAGVRCGQTLLPVQVAANMLAIQRHGYRLAANFAFLGCDVSGLATPHSKTELEFEPFRLDQLVRMSALIEATYEGSLDVPALNGMRGIADVLEGYRGTGSFVPERWFFVRHAGQDVGCLLLTEYPVTENWELIYMGLTPTARGNRWGVEITRFAQDATANAGGRALILGVDVTNHPALSMYARCGFHELERRLVYLKQFPGRLGTNNPKIALR